ncbi:hypothetical protein EON65_27990 [archaeon]|nr:MAG: hypothetical protein EON65_27990 [archaeon]
MYKRVYIKGGSEAGGEGRPINSRIRSPHPPIVRSPLMQLNSLPTRTSNPIGNQAVSQSCELIITYV